MPSRTVPDRLLQSERPQREYSLSVAFSISSLISDLSSTSLSREQHTQSRNRGASSIESNVTSQVSHIEKGMVSKLDLLNFFILTKYFRYTKVSWSFYMKSIIFIFSQFFSAVVVFYRNENFSHLLICRTS